MIRLTHKIFNTHPTVFHSPGLKSRNRPFINLWNHVLKPNIEKFPKEYSTGELEDTWAVVTISNKREETPVEFCSNHMGFGLHVLGRNVSKEEWNWWQN